MSKYIDINTGKEYDEIPQGKVQPLIVNGQAVTEGAHDRYYEQHPIELEELVVEPERKPSYNFSTLFEPITNRIEVQTKHPYATDLAGNSLSTLGEFVDTTTGGALKLLSPSHDAGLVASALNGESINPFDINSKWYENNGLFELPILQRYQNHWSVPWINLLADVGVGYGGVKFVQYGDKWIPFDAGAESTVSKRLFSPGVVRKVSNIPPEEMVRRNAYNVQSKLVGRTPEGQYIYEQIELEPLKQELTIKDLMQIGKRTNTYPVKKFGEWTLYNPYKEEYLIDLNGNVGRNPKRSWLMPFDAVPVSEGELMAIAMKKGGKLIPRAKTGIKVKTRLADGRTAGEREVGSFIKLKGENFFRRVNSDGTLTTVGVGKDKFPLYKAPARVKNYTTQQYYKNTVEAQQGTFKDPLTILPEDLKEGYLDRQQELVGKEAEFIIPLGLNNELVFIKGMPEKKRFTKVEPQVLDSIALNAGRYDATHSTKPIGIRKALGIALNESTLGMADERNNTFRISGNFNTLNKWTGRNLYSYNKDYRYVSPITINSAWISQNKNTINSYADAAEHYKKIYYEQGKEVADKWWVENKDYYNYLKNKEQDITTWNPYFPLWDQFLAEKNGRSLANYGEPGYKEKIYDFGNALISTEEGKQWWNSSGRDAYNKGKQEKAN